MKAGATRAGPIGRRAGRDRLVVDWTRCRAHGLCAELLPEVVGLDEWGYPLVADGPVPEDLRRAAVRARDACPVLALRLDRRP